MVRRTRRTTRTEGARSRAQVPNDPHDLVLTVGHKRKAEESSSKVSKKKMRAIRNGEQPEKPGTAKMERRILKGKFYTDRDEPRIKDLYQLLEKQKWEDLLT